MKKTEASLAVLALAALVCAGAWYLLSPGGEPAKTEPITIGEPALEQSAFIYIAEDLGFFKENSLNVTVRDDYPNGVGPIQDMLAGKLDLSVSAEYPAVMAMMRRENISIIGVIDRYQNEEIIGRRDRGVESISDLKGRRIGIPRGTICEFFLGRFLSLHGMSLSDVVLVDVDAQDSVRSISQGDLDAIIYYQPHIQAIKERLGDRAVSWPAQSSQLMYTVVACRDGWAQDNKETLDRFLKSLVQAERYSQDHPDEARLIVQRRLNLSDAYLEAVWPDHQFALSLDQSLLIAMNDEGRWAISNNLTDAEVPPDYRRYIFTPGLEKAKPDALNIR